MLEYVMADHRHRMSDGKKVDIDFFEIGQNVRFKHPITSIDPATFEPHTDDGGLIDGTYSTDRYWIVVPGGWRYLMHETKLLVRIDYLTVTRDVVHGMESQSGSRTEGN